MVSKRSVKSFGGELQEKGKRFKFGDGIYMTPDPATARVYATKFDFEKAKYKLVLQARVDPAHIVKVVGKDVHREPGCNGDYWIIRGDNHVRLYGICVYPI